MIDLVTIVEHVHDAVIEAGAVVAALASTVLVIRRWAKRIERELLPNGGTSLRDALDRIEQGLILGQQRQRALLADHVCGVYETDEHGELTWVNRTYSRITGRTQEELMHGGWQLVIHPDDRERVFHEWKSCVKAGRDFEMQYRVLSPNNDPLNVSGKAYNLRDREGNPMGYLGLLCDCESIADTSMAWRKAVPKRHP